MMQGGAGARASALSEPRRFSAFFQPKNDAGSVA